MKSYHVADDGYAFWVIPQNEQSDASDIDIHINTWIMPSKGVDNIVTYLDFGIRTRSIKTVKEICCYLPFPINANEFQDISLLLNDEKIARGVFNTNCTININGKTGISELKYNSHDENLAKLPSKIETISDGSIIHFYVESILKKLTKDVLYIRFRITNRKIGKFLSEKSDTLRSFATALSTPIWREDYSYTIRINEMRILPADIRHNEKLQKQKIRKVILTSCVNGPYTVDTTTCYKTRLIEKELFKDYVPEGFMLDNCLVGQWFQEKESFSHYNLTCLMHKEEVNKKSLMLYAFFVVCLSALGGGLVELIKLII